MPLPHIFAPLGAPPLPPIPTSYLDDNFAAAGVLAVSFELAAGTNAITLTPTSYTSAISAYTDGQIFSFVATANSTGAVTARVGTLAFKKLFVNATGTQATSGDVVLNQYYQVVYRAVLDSSAGGFQILYPSFVSTPLAGRWISPTDFGGDPTGVSDASAAVASAVTASASTGAPLVIDGLFRLNSATSITVPITFLAPGAFIQNSTLSFSKPIFASANRLFNGSGVVTIGASAGVPFVYPEWWGAVPDGSTDSTAALQAAINTASSVCTVVLGAGVYVTSTVVTLSPNLMIVGSGVNVSVLAPSTPSQTVFSLVSGTPVEANLTFRDFSILPSVAGVIGIALTFCSYSVVQNVHFVGCAKTVVLDRGRFHVIENCMSIASSVQAAGQLVVWSSTDTQTVFAGDQYIYFVTVRGYYVTSNTDFGITTRVVDPACYFRRCVSCVFDTVQGLHISSGSPGVGFMVLENDSQGNKFLNCTADAVAYLLLLQPGSGASVSPSYTEVTDCDGDFFWSAGIWLAGTVAAPITFVHINGGYITAQQVITSLGIYAIYANEVTITNTQIYNYLGILGVGIKVEHCNIVSVENCRIISMTSGIDFGVGGNTNIRLVDNWLNNNTANLVGTVSGGFNKIWNNAGLNPPALATPSIPATGVPYTNNSGYDLRICISGVVSAIAVNGLSTGLTSGMFVVNVGENITITHTGGAWEWMAM